MNKIAWLCADVQKRKEAAGPDYSDPEGGGSATTQCESCCVANFPRAASDA